ncbi:MAG: helicase, partial [Armatimonadetes bacterium]|nr:helicase [Armatimonadota bacterium]
FDAVLPGFFEELEEALMPEEGAPQLTMARYSPTRYALEREGDTTSVETPDDRAAPYERLIVGLLRSALLKRFESSVHAFARTCARMVETHERFLWALDQGYVARAEVLAELEDVDSDEALEELLRERGQDEADRYEAEALAGDVQRDRDLLQSWAEAAGRVTPQEDPKLAALVEQLARIAQQAQKDGLDETDRRNKRKVLIFSYYADTVDWIEGFLNAKVAEDERLRCYEGRIASVASDDSRGGTSRRQAIYGFAPVSTEAPPGQEDRFDILVCTDVLAEGMNLQQCRHVINYDLPWNPMRIVQRNGRIDRIGSPYDRVYARCVFPDEKLNEMLDLEGRIRGKLAQAAVTVSPDTPPIPDAPTGEQVYADSREEIERLLAEAPTLLESAGEDPSAYSGEEYRQELSRGMERHGDTVKRLPWAAGSGYLAEGKRRGWAFCARVGDTPRLRFVPADGSNVVRDTLVCLKHFTCERDTERHLPHELARGAYDAWARARADILEEWTKATDPANLQPRVPRVFREMAEHLLRYPPHDMTTEEVDAILERLEAPWPRRTQDAFRTAFTPDADGCDPYEVSRLIVAKVGELALTPYRAPEPLPPIDEDQIMLICWMAVSGR